MKFNEGEGEGEGEGEQRCNRIGGVEDIQQYEHKTMRDVSLGLGMPFTVYYNALLTLGILGRQGQVL